MTTSSPKIKLYTLSTCSHCIRAKEFFRDNNIETECKDVDLLTGEERERVIQEVRRLNPDATFPTICIDEKVLAGFNEENVRKALNLP
jgi:glutaredoxin-like protein NrdH